MENNNDYAAFKSPIRITSELNSFIIPIFLCLSGQNILLTMYLQYEAIILNVFIYWGKFLVAAVWENATYQRVDAISVLFVFKFEYTCRNNTKSKIHVKWIIILLCSDSWKHLK